ncbi:MAG: complex I subunit 5 family protein [Pirellulaceae bacterium]
MWEPLLQPIYLLLVAGFVCLALPRRFERTLSWLAIVTATLTLIANCILLQKAGFQATAVAGLFRVDPLSGLLVITSSVFTLLIAVYSLDFMRNKSGRSLYYACLLWSLGLANCVFLANDLVLLVTCWGMLAVLLYLMINLTGPKASEAARKSLVIVGGSDSLFLLGTALLWVQHGTTRLDTEVVALGSAGANLAFVCLMAAAFAKAGVFPLHSWIPDSGERAHSPVTAFLPCALDKLLGIYLLVRIVTDLFVMTEVMNEFLMFFGVVTIVGAALRALVQRDLKRLLAYCAVGQVGYILLGIGTGTALGLAAALFHMINHAIYKSCLFLGAGVIKEKTGTVDLDQLGGLATRLPVTFATFLVASLAVSGIPPLNGFASKWMVYQSIIESGQNGEHAFWIAWLTAAMIGSALTLALFVKVLHAVFLCKPSPQIRQAEIGRAAWSALLPMVLLAGICIVFGTFAYAIPLKLMIEPVVIEPITLPGTWWAGRASGLMLLAFGMGWMVYMFALRNSGLRKVPTFIGGERLDEARIPGVPTGAQRHVEVTGVDFYRTVQQLPVLKSLFVMARMKMFDIYSQAGKALARLIRVLQIAHNGLLPFYLIWFVLGLVAVVYLMMEGIR